MPVVYVAMVVVAFLLLGWLTGRLPSDPSPEDIASEAERPEEADSLAEVDERAREMEEDGMALEERKEALEEERKELEERKKELEEERKELEREEKERDRERGPDRGHGRGRGPP